MNIFLIIVPMFSFLIIYPFWKARQTDIKENDKRGIPTPPLR